MNEYSATFLDTGSITGTARIGLFVCAESDREAEDTCVRLAQRLGLTFVGVTFRQRTSA